MGRDAHRRWARLEPSHRPFAVALVALAFAVWPALAAGPAPGDFDASFGSGGKLITQLGAGSLPDSSAAAVALQPDGKIVIVGSARRPDNSFGPLVARFAPDGSP